MTSEYLPPYLLNIFSSISNELTKPIFVSLTMANDSFLKELAPGEE